MNKFVDAMDRAGLKGPLRRRCAQARACMVGPVVDQSQLDQDLRYLKIGPGRGREAAIGAASC